MLKKGNKWWILFVTATATSLFLLDSTLIPVALPTIQKQMGFSDVGVMWVMNAYLLALTAFLLIGGKLCEIVGLRISFNVGLALFGVGGLLAAFSQTGAFLLFSRVVQGMGSALAFPATAALIVSAFPENERTKALGIDTGIASLFMIIGPLIGGICAQYLSWRWIFIFYQPFVLFALGMSLWLVKRGELKRQPFPFFSSLLMVVGVVLLVFGLMEGNRIGWTHPLIITTTLLGPLFMVLFVIASLSLKHPLADFTLFSRPLYWGAVSCRFIAYFIVSGTALWIIYFEKILSYTPAEIGIFIVAAALPVIALAPIAGILTDKYGFRAPLLGGFTFLLLGLIWLAGFAYTGNLWIFLPGLCAFGMSLPFLMTPTLGLGISAAPDEQLGSASGMMMSVRQLASTMGIAVMTAAFYSVDESMDSKPFVVTVLIASALALLGIIAASLFVRDAKTANL